MQLTLTGFTLNSWWLTIKCALHAAWASYLCSRSMFVALRLAHCDTMSSAVLSIDHILSSPSCLALSPSACWETWQSTEHWKGRGREDAGNTFLANKLSSYYLPGNIPHAQIGPKVLIWLHTFPQPQITRHKRKEICLLNNVTGTTNKDKSYIAAELHIFLPDAEILILSYV